MRKAAPSKTPRYATNPTPTLCPNVVSPSSIPNLRILLQKLLRLVNLGRQIGAPAPIRMIQQHQLPVVFANLILRQAPLAATTPSVSNTAAAEDVEARPTSAARSAPPPADSSAARTRLYRKPAPAGRGPPPRRAIAGAQPGRPGPAAVSQSVGRSAGRSGWWHGGGWAERTRKAATAMPAPVTITAAISVEMGRWHGRLGEGSVGVRRRWTRNGRSWGDGEIFCSGRLKALGGLKGASLRASPALRRNLGICRGLHSMNRIPISSAFWFCGLAA
jgi:hypothetical protein